jgi:methylase of polypeptide subunit release factors
VEFGAGDGSPIISTLLKVPHAPGRAIHAYEISPASAHLACASAAKVGLGDTYVVHNSYFWEGLKQTPSDCIISNPPYLPAPGETGLTVCNHSNHILLAARDCQYQCA